MLALSRADVRALLDIDACIDAVEGAFVEHARGNTIGPGVLAVDAAPDGVFHLKAAGTRGPRARFAAKLNANFPANPRLHGMPSIQGVVVLYDAGTGQPLALMDGAELTSLRTAATTAVAARHLARRDATVLAVIGCGVQARAHLLALSRVRPIRECVLFDVARDAAEALATETTRSFGMAARVVDSPAAAARAGDICVTVTPARRALLGVEDARPGILIAGVGADNHDKQELDPRLLAASTVVVDVLAQCAREGDLHHAIAAGLMRERDVHAELADVVSGRKPGRESADQVIVFDSTGTALADVAAAMVVHDRAQTMGRGIRIALFEDS